LLRHCGERCDGFHEHVPCAGDDTKASEHTLRKLVDTVHRAFQQISGQSQSGAPGVPQLPAAAAPMASGPGGDANPPLPPGAFPPAQIVMPEDRYLAGEAAST
jgi:hypothetical protein